MIDRSLPSAGVVVGVDGDPRIAVGDAPGLTVRLSVVDGALDLTLGRTLVNAMSQGLCPVVVVPPRWDPAERHTGAVLGGVSGVGAAPCSVAVPASRAAARRIAPETVWAEEGV